MGSTFQMKWTVHPDWETVNFCICFSSNRLPFYVLQTSVLYLDVNKSYCVVCIVYVCMTGYTRRQRSTHCHNDRKLNNGKHPIRSEQMRFYVSANFLCVAFVFTSTSIRHHAIIASYCCHRRHRRRIFYFFWSTQIGRQTYVGGSYIGYTRIAQSHRCTYLLLL